MEQAGGAADAVVHRVRGHRDRGLLGLPVRLREGDAGGASWRTGEASSLKRMAYPISSHLAWGDNTSIHVYVGDTTKEWPDVSYAAVANEKGIFVGHSEASFEGKTWEGPGGAGEGAGTFRKAARFRGERMLEMALPVEVDGKRLGTGRHRAELPGGKPRPFEAPPCGSAGESASSSSSSPC